MFERQELKEALWAYASPAREDLLEMELTQMSGSRNCRQVRLLEMVRRQIRDRFFNAIVIEGSLRIIQTRHDHRIVVCVARSHPNLAIFNASPRAADAAAKHFSALPLKSLEKSISEKFHPSTMAALTGCTSFGGPFK